jgi:DNA-binding GntR family transcriptional regulator
MKRLAAAGKPAMATLGQRWTAADHVHEVLEAMVIEGELKPGDRLTELSLAEQLKVSRTPLRQALQRLVSKGWIQRSSNGAIYVVDVSDREIEALYAVRMALEEMMLCQAVERMKAPDHEELRGLLSRQEQAAKAGNAEQVSDYGEAFHRALWRMSGNEVGTQFLEDVLQRTTRYRRLSFSEPYRFREGLKQHAQLLGAIGKGEIEAARRIIRMHVEESRNYVLQAFRAWRDPKGASAVKAKAKAKAKR